MRSVTWSRLCLFVVLAVGAVLRVPGISGRTLWLDEAFSIRVAQFEVSELVARSAADSHPPLFYLLLKCWMAVFGDSALALRSLTAILGVSTIALVYLLARRVFRSALDTSPAASAPVVAGLLAAAWIALHPTHVAWSAQVRMYALAGLLAAGSGLVILRALEQPTWRRWAAWCAVSIALAYTHYYGTFVIFAQGIHALVCALRSDPTQRRTLVIRVVVAGAVMVAAFAPWIGVVATQAGAKADGWWVPPLTPARVLWTWARMPGLLSEDPFEAPTGGWAVLVGVLSFATAAITIASAASRDRALRLAAWCTLFPFVIGVAASLVVGQTVVLSRYLTVAEMFAPIAILAMIYRHVRHRLAVVLLVPIVICMLRERPALEVKPDITAGMNWIRNLRRPGDLVVAHQFFYWTFRIDRPHGDPQLRLFAERGRPQEFYGAALIDETDTVWSERDLATFTGRLFVVENGTFPVPLPEPLFAAMERRTFPVATPNTAVRITLYERSR